MCRPVFSTPSLTSIVAMDDYSTRPAREDSYSLRPRSRQSSQGPSSSHFANIHAPLLPGSLPESGFPPPPAHQSTSTVNDCSPAPSSSQHQQLSALPRHAGFSNLPPALNDSDCTCRQHQSSTPTHHGQNQSGSSLTTDRVSNMRYDPPFSSLALILSPPADLTVLKCCRVSSVRPGLRYGRSCPLQPLARYVMTPHKTPKMPRVGLTFARN